MLLLLDRRFAPDTHKLKQKKITSSTSIKRGDHVTLHDGRTGKVQYIGRVKYLKGEWYGLRLDPGHAGKNDGSFRGMRYFKCPKGQGLFVTRKRVKSKLSSPKRKTISEPPQEDDPKAGASKKTKKMRTEKAEEAESDVAKQGGERPSRPRNREPMRDSSKAATQRKSKSAGKHKRRESRKDPVPRQKSASEKVKDFPLRREPYFHGKMNRYGAEDVVKKKGQWLLRQERRGKMVVSVRKTRNNVGHTEVGYDEQRKVYNYSKNGSRKKIVYRDFEELVKSLGGKKPVLRKHDENSKRNPAAPAPVPSKSKDRRRPESTTSTS